ncbi:MAG: hypothetical protein Q4A62_01160 [Eikenella sp.]|nr:hypothetical protein [Eikenella sp.]
MDALPSDRLRQRCLYERPFAVLVPVLGVWLWRHLLHLQRLRRRPAAAKHAWVEHDIRQEIDSTAGAGSVFSARLGFEVKRDDPGSDPPRGCLKHRNTVQPKISAAGEIA